MREDPTVQQILHTADGIADKPMETDTVVYKITNDDASDLNSLVEAYCNASLRRQAADWDATEAKRKLDSWLWSHTEHK
jgi:hypothetical protein